MKGVDVAALMRFVVNLDSETIQLMNRLVSDANKAENKNEFLKSKLKSLYPDAPIAGKVQQIK